MLLAIYSPTIFKSHQTLFDWNFYNMLFGSIAHCLEKQET